MSDALWTTKPIVGSVAPWFGAKAEMAPVIVELLGEHHSYYEPFCGGCAVLLAKPPATAERVNDRNGHLSNLLLALASLVPHSFILRLERTLLSESTFRIALEQLHDRDPGRWRSGVDWDMAWAAFVVWWMGVRGVAGTRQQPRFGVRFDAGGGGEASRWNAAVASLPAFVERFRTVTVTNRDAHQLLDAVTPEPGVAVYSDPPYVREGDAYAVCNVDHMRLAQQHDALARGGATVVVSYYDDPLVRQLYKPEDGWRWLVWDRPHRAGQAGRGDGRKAASEVLIFRAPGVTRITPLGNNRPTLGELIDAGAVRDEGATT